LMYVGGGPPRGSVHDEHGARLASGDERVQAPRVRLVYIERELGGDREL